MVTCWFVVGFRLVMTVGLVTVVLVVICFVWCFAFAGLLALMLLWCTWFSIACGLRCLGFVVLVGFSSWLGVTVCV